MMAGCSNEEAAPDDERLLVVALCREGYDVVRALQLRKGVRAGVPPQLHTAATCLAVYHACAHGSTALWMRCRAQNKH